MIIASYCTLGTAGSVYICLPYFLYRDPKLYLHFHWILVVHIVHITVDYLFTYVLFLWLAVSDNHMFYRFGLLTVLCAFFLVILYDQFHCKEKKILYKCIYIINIGFCISASFLSGAGENDVRGTSVGEMRKNSPCWQNLKVPQYYQLEHEHEFVFHYTVLILQQWFSCSYINMEVIMVDSEWTTTPVQEGKLSDFAVQVLQMCPSE